MIFDYTEIYLLRTIFPPDITFYTTAKNLSDLSKVCFAPHECYYNFTQVVDFSVQNENMKCLGDVCYTGDLDKTHR
jgi:hypothetical protein